MTDTLDLAVYAELQETMGEDFAAELVQTFLDEAPGMLSELLAADASGDADGFRRAAHSIKSNASTFGASALAEEARALELEASPGTAASSLARLETTWDATATALRGLIDG